MPSEVIRLFAGMTLIALGVSSAASLAAEHRFDHWSFKPVVRPEPPAVQKTNWPRNPIDRFILAKLEQNSLKPSVEADRRTLIRRLSFDLIGLPPTFEQIEAFVDDASPDAYEKLVDHLLASPRYGERWARHWLDVVRFADSFGYERNSLRPNAWRYRDYVIRSLNVDKPYDQFLREQIAGDALGADEGTGFLVGGPADQVKGKDPALAAQQRADELNDMVATTGSAILGLTVGCARCHDHKFDPISQVDYYQMTAIYAGVQHADRAIKSSATRDEDDGVVAAARKRLAEIEASLEAYEPIANPAATFVLVDEANTTALLPPTAPKTGYAGGTDRGRIDDPGSSTTLPNLGKGFVAWKKVAKKDVFAWKPSLTGRYRVWLSWANGRSGHAGDVMYHLDADGDLSTTRDRAQIAMVDQRRFAGGGGGVAVAPLWSGFFDAGVHDLTPTSTVVLQGGAAAKDTVTSDVLLLEAVPAGASFASARSFPLLRDPVRAGGNVDRFFPVRASVVRFTALEASVGQARLDSLEVFAAGSPLKRIASVNPSVLSENAVTVQLPQMADIERVRWGIDAKGSRAVGLPIRYRVEVAASASGPWTLVATERDRLPYFPENPAAPIRNVPAADVDAARALDDLLNEKVWLNDRVKSVRGPAIAYAGKFGQAKPSFRLNRGEPSQPREQVHPGAISSIGPTLSLPFDAPEQERRIKLAAWITDQSNPLPARVIVNRLWHYHFGQGIVNTPSDFGHMGAKPSHPELLDWLASELVDKGWSLKRLHRLIVTSATYRQASDWREDGAKIDGTTALLWRHPPARLDAESLRDAILAVSGKLNLAMGGPGFSPFKPDGNFVRVYEAREDFGPVEWRRMIYQTKPRIHQDGTFGAFDCPDGAQIAPKRTNSTTPLQALNLLNSPFMLQQSSFLAERVKRESNSAGGPPAEVDRLFRIALGRVPTAQEQASFSQFTREYGLAALCRVMLNANEFLYVY